MAVIEQQKAMGKQLVEEIKRKNCFAQSVLIGVASGIAILAIGIVVTNLLERQKYDNYREQTLYRITELGESGKQCEQAFTLCSNTLGHEIRMTDFYKATSEYRSLEVSGSRVFAAIARKEPQLSLTLSNGKCTSAIYWHDNGNIRTMITADCLTGKVSDLSGNGDVNKVSCQSLEALKEKGVDGFFIKQWLVLALYHYGNKESDISRLLECVNIP